MSTEITPRPFVKWAGGKSQLLEAFADYYPAQLYDGRLTRYVEPFLGGGAVFFHLKARFNLDCLLADSNPELINAFLVVQNQVEDLIEQLQALEEEYLHLPPAERPGYYYQVRDDYNHGQPSAELFAASSQVQRASQFIFLNHTCYNGLYRINSRGFFNVPVGRYERPRIYDAANLRAASRLLAGARIVCQDYSECFEDVDATTLVYFDPPFRPLSRTANFTAYSGVFNDQQQKDLATFFRKLHEEKHPCLMLSNSDPRNTDSEDTFLEDLYQGFYINRLPARRLINSDKTKRGRINELFITNYPPRVLW